MIHVRPAKFKELDIIADFQVKMADETEQLTLSTDEVRKGVESIFEDSQKGTYYVAVDDDENVLGCLMTTSEFSEWRNGTVLWIQSVYVRKENRKQGIYKQMYEYLKKMVEEDDELMGIRLYVDMHNQAAQRVYINMGMKSDHYKLYEWMKDF